MSSSSSDPSSDQQCLPLFYPAVRHVLSESVLQHHSVRFLSPLRFRNAARRLLLVLQCRPWQSQFLSPLPSTHYMASCSCLRCQHFCGTYCILFMTVFCFFPYLSRALPHLYLLVTTTCLDASLSFTSLNLGAGFQHHVRCDDISAAAVFPHRKSTCSGLVTSWYFNEHPCLKSVISSTHFPTGNLVSDVCSTVGAASDFVTHLQLSVHICLK